jgi:hypothetical protein
MEPMTRSLFKHQRIMVGLLGALLLSPTLRMAGTVHAASPAPGNAAQYATVPTNLPNVFAFPTPPAGFNPSTARTADLERYGFPLPPDQAKYPQQYQQWVDAMRHAKHVVVPSFTPQPEIRHNVLSTNWSGTVVTAPRSTSGVPTTTFTTVLGTWTVPSVAKSTRTSYSSTWIGLDGGVTTSNQVEQIGTEEDMNCGSLPAGGCTTPAPAYYAWFELFPDPSVQINSVLINPGDQIFARVEYVRMTNRVDFFISDYSTNTLTNFQVAAKYGAPGTTAEWIQERPTIGKVLPALANFGQVQVTNRWLYTNTGASYLVNLSPYPTAQWDMVGSTLLAHADPTFPNTVRVKWLAYS